MFSGILKTSVQRAFSHKLVSKKTCLLNSSTVIRQQCSLKNFVTGFPVLIRREMPMSSIDNARPNISHGIQFNL